MWPLLLAVAWAHPFGNAVAAHKVDLDLHGDHLEIRYLADVPNPLLRTMALRGEAPLPRMLSELESGLVLTIDGSTVPITIRERETTTVREGEHTHLLRIVGVAPLEPGAHTIMLSNGNLPDVSGYFNTQITADGRITVHEASTLTQQGSKIKDLSDRWRIDPSMRTLRVSITVGGSWIWVWNHLLGVETGAMPARLRLPPTLGEQVRRERWTPVSVFLALGATCLLLRGAGPVASQGRLFGFLTWIALTFAAYASPTHWLWAALLVCVAALLSRHEDGRGGTVGAMVVTASLPGWLPLLGPLLLYILPPAASRKGWHWALLILVPCWLLAERIP